MRRVAIPEVVGLHVDDARIVLSNAGFERCSIHYTEDYVREFEVVDQFPRPGLLVAKDVDVQLRICRMSLVQYLPQVFQQSAMDGESFLKGFLYIAQSLYDSTNQRIANIHELFDPRTTDADFLPWLASWLAITLNPDWTPLQRRRMLMAATQLFPDRGTARAIREFVRIYVGANVEIEENSWPFEGFRIGVHSTVGADTVILPPMNLAHCFVVRLDKPASQTPEDEIIKIHQIIQSQKPAHASYFLAFSDESESGVMGSFMAIGVAGDEAEGVMGMGIGIGMGGVAFETDGSAEPTSGMLYAPDDETAATAEVAGDDGKKKPKTSVKKPKTSAKSGRGAATSSESAAKTASTSPETASKAPKTTSKRTASASKKTSTTSKTSKTTKSRRTAKKTPKE
ncbi:MAG: phage tail-like protein [Myxococcota bacterium]